MSDEPADPAPPAASDPGLASAPGIGGAPGAPPPPMVPRSRALYDPATGKLDVKKLGAWVGGLVAIVGTLSATMGKIESGVKWWLEIDALERRAATCETQLEAIDDELHPDPPPRDANARLSEALPRISSEMRDARKERQMHEHAITRLSTIHEFGLTRTREREAAQEARQAMRERAPGGSATSLADDPIVSLEGL